MTDKLPPNLLALFAPRPPLRWVPPSDFAPEDRKTANITGLAAFLPALQEYKETDVYEPTESWLQRKDRVKLEKKAAHEKIIQEAPKLFKPSEDPNIRGDAFKTLIVSRLDYDATEKDLEREFGRFGPIERIRIVVDTHQHEKPGKKIKKHRGYAFVVFEREKDMRAGLENCDGIRIKDRRIKVDVERGRTVKGWLPRRLGGGLGGRGYTKSASSRPMGPGGFNGPPGGPGGFRGGFRGGFDGGRGRGGFRGGFDRGGFGGGGGGGGGGGRGGIGFQGRGGFGDRGDRGGYGGGGSNGYAPPNAPAGPGGGGRGGFNGGGGFGGRGGGGFGAGSPDRNGPGGSSGGYDSRGGRSYDDRSGGYRGNSNRGYGDRDGGPPRGGSGSNMEPVRPRDGSGYRDRDGPRDGGYGGRPREEDSRKRPYDSNGYEEDPRKLRRY
ncbi:uncharacterized protein EAF01_003183 [Botrytis porri]|uniref:uncharacterized protein n=1 Tax=Botrytis porri TaxID=87229 RepID=UPI0018FF1238|nr:uncharacterized protein EAF01_003183 [Botrytis porri]KAF7909465.1 hypothetical protein EAF01_003183 [Botrytis porri]